MFSVSEDGEKTICSNDKTLYLEDWQQDIRSPTRITELTHKMDNEITFLRADFEKDFVVSGDSKGFVIIQRISTNEVLLDKTQIFKRSSSVVSSSMLNYYLCIGNIDGDIITIDLRTFNVNSRFLLEDDSSITTLDIVEIGTETYVIASCSGNRYTFK
jgi:hypothetical protein